MITIYKTKCDINGNIYCVKADSEKKEYSLDANYSPFGYSDKDIRVSSRKELHRIADLLEGEGYTRVY